MSVEVQVLDSPAVTAGGGHPGFHCASCLRRKTVPARLAVLVVLAVCQAVPGKRGDGAVRPLSPPTVASVLHSRRDGLTNCMAWNR